MKQTWWSAWAVVMDGERLNCVLNDKAAAENEADRYEDAKVIPVVVKVVQENGTRLRRQKSGRSDTRRLPPRP